LSVCLSLSPFTSPPLRGLVPNPRALDLFVSVCKVSQ
jgi:hypothetical protein